MGKEGETNNRFQYNDFVHLANEAAQQGRREEAMEIVKFLLQYFPERVFRGGFHQQGGEQDKKE